MSNDFGVRGTALPPHSKECSAGFRRKLSNSYKTCVSNAITALEKILRNSCEFLMHSFRTLRSVSRKVGLAAGRRPPAELWRDCKCNRLERGKSFPGDGRRSDSRVFLNTGRAIRNPGSQDLKTQRRNTAMSCFAIRKSLSQDRCHGGVGHAPASRSIQPVAAQDIDVDALAPEVNSQEHLFCTRTRNSLVASALPVAHADSPRSR